MSGVTKAPTNRLLYWLAAVAAVLTFALLLAGATVTTLDVGMADTVWPTPPWYLAVLSASGRLLEHGVGFFVEHLHRLVGWVVGFLVLGLAGLAWSTRASREARALSLAMLSVVAIQGVLGGIRVLLVSRELAVVHGLVAHLFFCLCVVSALRLKPGRAEVVRELVRGSVRRASRLRAAQVAMALVALQLLTGTVLRHLGLGLHLHVLGAVLAAFACIGLGFSLLFLGEEPLFTGRAWLLLAGSLLQVVLGVVAWLTASGFGPYALETVTPGHALGATAHMLLGSVLFAAVTSLVVDIASGISPVSTAQTGLQAGFQPAKTKA